MSNPAIQPPQIHKADDQAGQTSTAFTAYALVGGFGAVSCSEGSLSVLLMNGHAHLSRDGESFAAHRNDNPSSSMTSGSGMGPAASSPENVRSTPLGAINSHGANESGKVEGPVRISDILSGLGVRDHSATYSPRAMQSSVRISDILNDLGVRDHSATLPPRAIQSTVLVEGEVRDDTYMPKSSAAQGAYLSQHAKSIAQHSSEGRFKIEPAQYHGPGSAFGVDTMKGIIPHNRFSNSSASESGNPGLSKEFSVNETADIFLSGLEATYHADHQYVQREADLGLSLHYSAGLQQPAGPKLQTPSSPPSTLEVWEGSEGPLEPENGVLEELLTMAGKIGLRVGLEATPLGPFGYSASLDLGGMKLSLPGPFKTELEGKAAVCRKGLLLLKPMLPEDPNFNNFSGSAAAPLPASCEPPVLPNTPICYEMHMETPWTSTLHNWCARSKCGKPKYVQHKTILGVNSTICWRFDVKFGGQTFYCYDYYLVAKAAKRAVAKIAVTQLWKRGLDIKIPQDIIQLLDLKKLEGSHEIQRLQPTQKVNKKQMATPPYRPQDGGKAKKTAKQNARTFLARGSPHQADPGTKENTIALGPRRLRELTADEIMEAKKTQNGREPDSFEGLLTNINSLCYTLQIHVPFFEIVPDSIRDDVFSGVAIFPPHPLTPNARVGEVLHVFGRQRARELCAIGVLAFLEELVANTAMTGGSGGLRNITSLQGGRKRKAEEQEIGGIDGPHIKVERLK